MSDDYDPLDTSAREDAAKASQAKAALDLANEINDLKWLMGNRRGRRIVYRLLAKAGVYLSSFNSDALVMALNEGRRSYGTELLGQLTVHCPEQYMTMLQEKTT